MPISLVTSTVAIVVSVIALVRTVRHDRRDLLLQLHAEFISRDNSRGRSLLHSAFRPGEPWWENISSEDRRLINSAMSQLDALSMQVLNRYVSQKHALILWGATILECASKSKDYLEDRRKRENTHKMIFIEGFAELARKNPKLSTKATVRDISPWWKRKLRR